MNDVSWRRILEQADSKEPFGRDQHAPNPPQRAVHPEQSPQENVDWSSLEAELSRATHPGTQSRPARPRRPSPGQHATQLKMRMEQASVQTAPPVREPKPKSARQSGARNFIALSLSLAVVGFAAQQLGERLPQAGSAPDEASTAQNAGIAFASAGNGEDAEPIIRASGNRLDLRPTLASQADSPSEQLSAAKATTAAPVNTANLATVLPDVPEGALEDGENEALVLNRGRDILERGHISGARLIFEYLADRGSALGAFALAQTYDTKFISKNNLPADAADEALATKWYRQAAEITNAAAPDTQ